MGMGNYPCIKDIFLWWFRFINKINLSKNHIFFIIRVINGLTTQTRVVSIINILRTFPMNFSHKISSKGILYLLQVPFYTLNL